MMNHPGLTCTLVGCQVSPLWNVEVGADGLRECLTRKLVLMLTAQVHCGLAGTLDNGPWARVQTVCRSDSFNFESPPARAAGPATRRKYSLFRLSLPSS